MTDKIIYVPNDLDSERMRELHGMMINAYRAHIIDVMNRDDDFVHALFRAYMTPRGELSKRGQQLKEAYSDLSAIETEHSFNN